MAGLAPPLGAAPQDKGSNVLLCSLTVLLTPPEMTAKDAFVPMVFLRPPPITDSYASELIMLRRPPLMVEAADPIRIEF